MNNNILLLFYLVMAWQVLIKDSSKIVYRLVIC